jgi:hypothetical protein
MRTPKAISLERQWKSVRWFMVMAGVLLGLHAGRLTLAAATETSVEPPRVVSNFVSTENIRSHFFNNMFRALQLPDGRIIALSPVGREADAKMQARYSTDDGKTWSAPEDLFDWPKEASKFYTAEALLDHEGEIHIVMVCDKAMWYTRSTNGRTRWESPKTILTVPPGNPLSFIQLRNGRLLLPFEFLTARSWDDRGGGFADFTYLGTFSASSVYSDDGGKTWQRSPDEITVETPDLNTWGASEPVVIQLKDGRVWMLIRTQRGRFYQSFSEDGAHWSPARPTTLFSSDSPAGLLRLKDGSILFFSNACQGYPYAYGARNVLHVAISKDEGRTWRGFREVARDPLRGEPPLAEGDYGLAYTFPTQTADGHVLFTNWVQSGRDRSFRLLDPAWIYETRQATDFSKGIDDWSSFGTRGVELAPDPAKPEAHVLRVHKSEKDWPAGAVWNFPIGSKGRLKMDLMLRPGFGGTLIGLTDHFSIPWDIDDRFHNVFNFPIPADGQIFPNLKLTSGKWHEITLDWDSGLRKCKVSVDGKLAGVLWDERHATGINYLRVRSVSSQPDAGLLLRAVSVDVSASWAESGGPRAETYGRKSAQSPKSALDNGSNGGGEEQ